MSSETLFYVFGIALAVSAVGVSFLGLWVKGFPGKAFPLVVLWFVVLVGGATTYSVLHAQHVDEEKAHEFEQANEEIEAEEEDVEAEEAPAEGGTLQLAAEPTALAFDTTELTGKPGKVTIDLDNPSAIAHDVAIEKDGKEIAGSELVTEGKTSVSAELAPGDYTFLCTVPGHAEAGMEGTLTVR
ncbi:MAG TPA: plastocyanin/azurin family copper-binding protein [Solirubrobacterales bacterium]|jgi:plastocyanin|nr:plastocyanin/azurin family copper-binding protein [Solirubrobacterales bacterium]